jgi:hypothetical protein
MTRLRFFCFFLFFLFFWFSCFLVFSAGALAPLKKIPLAAQVRTKGTPRAARAFFAPPNPPKKTKKMPRGRRLEEILTHEELQRKRGDAAEHYEHARPHAGLLPRSDRGSDEPPRSDILSRIWDAKSTAFTFVRRVLVCFVVVAIALVLHMQEGFRVRVAALVGTTSSSPLVQIVSTALPLSAAASVLLAWFV